MATITKDIQLSKARVLDEVAKTTAYIGSKAVSQEDPLTYERISTTDANREQLDRYWMEACSDLSTVLDHWAASIRSQTLTHHPEIGTARDYLVRLSLPTNWAAAYATTLEEVAMSFLVNSIVAKWLLLTMPSQVETYAALAGAAGQQIAQLLLARVRPTRRSSGGGGDDQFESATWNANDLWEREYAWITT